MLSFPIYSTIVFVSCVFAIPIQQHNFELNHYIPPTNSYNNLNALESYYGEIVSQVVDAAVSEVIETAPETYLIIHGLQFAGRGFCRITLKRFMDVLEHELNGHVKDNLMMSIRPLLEGYRHDDIIKYNKYMSQQLGLLLNPRRLTRTIVKKVYHENQENKNTSTVLKIWKLLTDRKWAETVHHESNEAMAVEAWLQAWLLDIEDALRDDFDANIYSLSLTL